MARILTLGFVLFRLVFQALHITFQCQLCISVSALGAKLFLCDSTASKRALFAQPQPPDSGISQIHLMY